MWDPADFRPPLSGGDLFRVFMGQISSGGMKEYLLRATDPSPMHISLYMQIIHD